VVTRNPCALHHLLIAFVTLGLWAGGGSPAITNGVEFTRLRL